MATGSGGGSSGGKAGDVRGGGAYFEFWGKDKITGMLEGLKKRALAVGKFMTQMGSAALKGGIAMAIPAVALLAKGVNRAAEVDRLAEAWGMSVEQMSRFSYAAEVAGVALEEVIANQTKYQDLIDKAPAIDTATAKAATQSTREFRSALITLQDALTPLIREMTPFFTAISAFAKQNARVVQIVAVAAVGLLAFGAAASVLGALITGTTVTLSTLAVAFAPLLKIAVITALVVALGYGLFKLLKQFELGERLVGDFANAMSNLKDIGQRALVDIGQAFGTMFGGIVDAFKAGDLRLAGEIAMKGLEVVWKRTVLAMTETWVAFKANFVDGWHMIVASAKTAFKSILPVIKQELTHIAAALVHTILTAIDRLFEALQSAARSLPVGGGEVADQLQRAREGLHGLAADSQKAAEANLREAGEAIQKVKNEEMAALMQLLAANKAFRDRQVGEAKQEFEKAIAELNALRAQAAAAAALAQAPATRGRRFNEPIYIPKPEELSRSVRSSLVLISGRQQFGAGDNLSVPKSTLRETQQIGKTLLIMLRHTAKLELIANEIENLGFGFE